MLNSNEIRLLLSELPLEGSFIQKITEHDWHSFTFHMFSRTEKAWLMYVEIANADQHFCRTGTVRKKSAHNQRFTQFLKARLVGSKIESVEQLAGERLFTFNLVHGDERMKIRFRFYSGSAANVIVTDEDGRIIDLLLRRPKRGEVPGEIYTQAEAKAWDEERFPIRPWEGDSFNAFIDRQYSEADRLERREDALSSLKVQAERELSALRTQIRETGERVEKSVHWQSYKDTADLLSSFSHLIRRGESTVQLTDWHGNSCSVALDPKLDASGNINAWYQKYKRQQRIHENALQELADLKRRLEERTQYYNSLLDENSQSRPEELEKAVRKQNAASKSRFTGPGLHFTSHGFDLIVGRNAKENDEILRKSARSTDTWIHVRDFAGGYVIIKGRKNKSIPLEVLLDGAYLAIHYSKAKSQKKADLYYTQVKYLRRIKDGKTGLVTPTQEKNLFVTVDEEALGRLLLTHQEEK